MTHVLIVGNNTYATEAEALAYLETRLKSMTLWPALAQATKLAALSSAFYMLETMWAWKGTKTGVTQLATVAVGAGGTGYTVGDIATLVGGAGEAAQVKVLTAPGGIVATFQLIHTGYYTTAPSGTLATTGGTGTGLTVTFTAHDEQQTDWPRTGTGVDGVSDGSVPDAIKEGQIQLAFELTQDADLESATNANANTRRMQVGSLSIEYFRAEVRNRFPTIVWSLIAELVGSDGSDAAPKAYGGDGESSFEETSPSGITGGGY